MDEAPVRIAAHGLTMVGAEEHRPYLEAVRQGRREAFMAEVLEEAVRPGQVVVDVGAFLGHFTLLAARAAGPSGRVHAFEPDPRDHPWLVRNIEINGFTDRVSPQAAAVSDRAGTALLHLARQDRSQSSIVFATDAHDAIPVPTVALDPHLPPGVEVGVIKIDVEGAELQALGGMERVLTGSPGVSLFIEVNPGALGAAGSSTEELLDRLGGLGFGYRLIDEDRRELSPFDGRVEGVNFVNLLCTRRLRPG
ncbi:MAG TPA: FkbM family methyltransferase [Actinomycetota bacterium]